MESLLAVPIKDDEIFELLERLAATEEMFKAPVSTIRDVAELTDASPNLIARLLGEMRGPGEFEKLVGRLNTHDDRITEIEKKVSQLGKQENKPAEEQRINRPNIVGSTVQPGRTRAPKVQEGPPQAWVANKQRIEAEKVREWQRITEEAQGFLVKYLAYLALAIAVVWMAYSALTSPASIPDVPIVR